MKLHTVILMILAGFAGYGLAWILDERSLPCGIERFSAPERVLPKPTRDERPIERHI